MGRAETGGASTTRTDRAARIAEIRRCLELLREPGDVFEVRALDVPLGRNYRGTVSGYYHDLERAAADVLALDELGAAGVYTTINTAMRAVLARSANRMTERPKDTTTDAEIIRRRWLLLDIDPDRPTGIAATDDERQVAIELAADIEDVLRCRGWSHPLLADSGNGVYLLYAVDLPNDDETTALIKRFYLGLQSLIDGERGAHIDTAVFNAARIIRIGGTTNRKGDSTPDRPHRRCEYRVPIADCPTESIALGLIQAVADLAPQPTAKTGAHRSGGGHASRLDVARWLTDRHVEYRTKRVDGGTAYLVSCPFDSNHGGNDETAVMQADSGLLTYECKHHTCQGRRWADYRDAIGEPAPEHYDPPRQRVDAGKRKQGEGAPKTNGQAVPTIISSLVTRSYEDIQVEAVSWLWKGRIPLGKLSLVAGVPGVGKTFLLCDIAARCSRGGTLPDGACAPQCETLILTAEDGPEDTIKPRLVAHGAVCSRVHHYDKVDIGGKEAYFTLTGYLDVLDKWLDDHRAVKLVVFDPITAYLGDGIDSHKNAEVRAALGPLCKLAEERDVAIVGITHLSKGQAKAINRVIGSIAFVGAARACWLVDWDPETDGRRLFLPIKNNLAHADGLAYTITDGRIEWESAPVTITADDLSDSQHTTPRDEAETWLRQALTDGKVPSTKLAAEATREGISERTLNRAKKRLGVVSERDGGAWYWSLPDEPNTSGIVGQTGPKKFDFGEYTA